MIDRWDKLTNYLLDGRLEIDTNWVENDIRPSALGKKNWLFMGSPRGAKAACVFYSLIATAKANGLEPYAYLNYMFNHIRDCNTDADYAVLLPFNLTPEMLVA